MTLYTSIIKKINVRFIMMGSSPLDLYAREYFTSLNSIAEKISADISNAVAAYEDLWHTLNLKDQHQIINETIIHPDVVVKYSLSHPNGYDDLQNKTSIRYLAEEGKVLAWPDEHAAPFSWKTRSQQNLSVFVDSSDYHFTQSFTTSKSVTKVNCSDISFESPNIVLGGSSSKVVSGQQGILSKPENSRVSLRNNKSKSVILRIQTSAPPPKKHERLNVHSMGDSENLVKHNGQCKISRCQTKSIPKPKTPPPPPPPKLKLQNQSSSSCSSKDGIKDSLSSQVPWNAGSSSQESPATFDDLGDFTVDINKPIVCDSLPKTGFDFLDNW